MMVANSFDLWQKDTFFTAAEEVQHSADMYVYLFLFLCFMIWVYFDSCCFFEFDWYFLVVWMTFLWLLGTLNC